MRWVFVQSESAFFCECWWGIKCSACVFWAPRERMHVCSDGIECVSISDAFLWFVGVIFCLIWPGVSRRNPGALKSGPFYGCLQIRPGSSLNHHLLNITWSTHLPGCVRKRKTPSTGYRFIYVYEQSTGIQHTRRRYLLVIWWATLVSKLHYLIFVPRQGIWNFNVCELRVQFRKLAQNFLQCKTANKLKL